MWTKYYYEISWGLCENLNISKITCQTDIDEFLPTRHKDFFFTILCWERKIRKNFCLLSPVCVGYHRRNPGRPWGWGMWRERTFRRVRRSWIWGRRVWGKRCFRVEAYGCIWCVHKALLGEKSDDVVDCSARSFDRKIHNSNYRNQLNWPINYMCDLNSQIQN